MNPLFSLLWVHYDRMLKLTNQHADNVAAAMREPLLADRLAKLFTVGHVEIRPATDATTIGSSTQNGFRIAVRTTMLDGSILPASGTLTIEAFDLDTKAGDPRLGSWTFTPEQMKTSWYDGFGLYHFAFDCPWTRRPEHSSITFKVHFVEALTGQTFVDQKTLTVQLRTPETAPATQPELTPATTQAG